MVVYFGAADVRIGVYQQDIKKFESAISSLKDPQPRAFAAKTVSLLKMYLAAV